VSLQQTSPPIAELLRQLIVIVEGAFVFEDSLLLKEKPPSRTQQNFGHSYLIELVRFNYWLA
jgi:hypothetical protein